ncbi:MAG: hypothetical protein R2860_13250 [Desulfobacterales bacterium]
MIPRYLFLWAAPWRKLARRQCCPARHCPDCRMRPPDHRTDHRPHPRPFDEPIYAIIGGLHYPVYGGRIMISPVNIQRIVGSDRPPWTGIRESDVDSAIAAIKSGFPKIVALSPHEEPGSQLVHRPFPPGIWQVLCGPQSRTRNHYLKFWFDVVDDDIVELQVINFFLAAWQMVSSTCETHPHSLMCGR